MFSSDRGKYLVLGYSCGTVSVHTECGLILLTLNYQEKEPTKYNVAQKPTEINCMAHGLRGATRSNQMAKAGINQGIVGLNYHPFLPLTISNRCWTNGWRRNDDDANANANAISDVPSSGYSNPLVSSAKSDATRSLSWPATIPWCTTKSAAKPARQSYNPHSFPSPQACHMARVLRSTCGPIG